MTFSQSKQVVLKVLRGWNISPRIIDTVTQTITDNAGHNVTIQTILNAAAHLRHIRHDTPEQWIVGSPEFMERFAETAVNPNFYGNVHIVVDPAVPSGEAYLVQSPRVAQQ